MAKKKTSKPKVKSKLTKPSFSITRNGYKFSLSFSNIDSDADYIYIEVWVYEARDGKKSTAKQLQYKKQKLGAKKNSSWTYTGVYDNRNKYYPLVGSGQSDYSKRLEKVKFKMWTEGKVTWETTSGKGKKKKTTKHSKNIKSDSVTHEYVFDNAVKPTVALTYNQDKTSFTYGIDINDDYGLNSNAKKVTTRVWSTLKQLNYGSKNETVVSGYGGQWYNKDTAKNIRNKITTKISPDKPVRFKAYAYAAGPGGKSAEVTAMHVFAKPKPPKAPTLTIPNILKSSSVDKAFGIYDVNWSIDTEKAWYPVDNVTIQYRDQAQHKGASDIYGENMGSWSTAKGNIHSSITRIQTDELGAPADNNVRYFRILAEHDGNVTPGYVTGIAGYGKISNVSGLSATSETVGGKQVLRFKWTAPSCELYGTDPDSEYYNGGKMGNTGRLRIYIYKGTTKNAPIKKIYYKTASFGSTEWENCEWVYEIPSSDLDKQIDYCFQVHIGRDNLNPGGQSDNLWLRNIVVPAKCTNVKGTRLANNTTVELTWDNPTKDDTVRNGIEVAWSTMPNAWESNSPPSTTTFDDGAMTKAYITGLTAGEFYYFWVRRYEETESGTNYGIWSDPSPGVLMADKPSTPTLTLSRSWIKPGGIISAQWVYYASGNLPQTSAHIELSNDNSKWTSLETVSGEEDRVTIDLSTKVLVAQDDATKIKYAYTYPPGTYYLRVVVSNSLGTATSSPIELRIAEPPTCTLTSESIVDYSYISDVDDTGTTETITVKALRSLPLKVTTTGNGNLNLYVYARNEFEWEHPDNVENIFNGDCVWTSTVEAGDYTIDDIPLADNGHYRVQLECVDPETLLTAESQFIDFDVHWEHQAVEPNTSTVEIDDETWTATLTPVKPEGALDTDVCDVYRTTADGRYLCYKGASWGTNIIDKYPTFGETAEPAYCFCTRTPDGDEAWCDMAYELKGSGIIVDYDKEVLRLPWNVSIDDNRSKQGELRSHLGGTKLYYGQPFIDRSQSLSTDIIKIDNEDLVAQLYELSRYTELCYVRTSNCLGYPATVDVSINRAYNNKIVSVSLSAKEADANGEFLGENPLDITETT